MATALPVPEEATPQTQVQEKKKSRVTAGQWCSAINCKNCRRDNPNMSFFRFPKDSERSKIWIINTQRKDLEKKTGVELHRSNVLCEDHFEASQFTSPRTHLRSRLKQKAIPTLFDEPNPDAIPIEIEADSSQLAESDIELVDNSANVEEDCLWPLNLEFVPKFTKNVKTQTPWVTCLDRVEQQTFKKKINNLQSTNKKLRESLSLKTSQSLEVLDQIQKRTLLEQLLSEHLSGDALRFVLSQFRTSGKNVRRFSKADMGVYLSLYKASRKGYRILGQTFKLPRKVTLQRMLKNSNQVHMKVTETGTALMNGYHEGPSSRTVASKSEYCTVSNSTPMETEHPPSEALDQ